MKMLKLSPWHDGSVKPVHVGVYQSEYSGWYRLWNGKFWMWGAFNAKAASKSVAMALTQEARWRGVMK